MNATRFKKWGRGKNLKPDELTEPWQKTVREDAIWMSEYGTPFDLRTLPARQFDAHMAILEGRGEEQQKQNREAEREAKRADRQT